MYSPNFNPLLQFEGEMKVKQLFYFVSFLLIDLGGWFFDVIQFLIFLYRDSKRNTFSHFSPLALPSLNLGIAVFPCQIIPTQKYQIHCQSIPIVQVWPILTGIDIDICNDNNSISIDYVRFFVAYIIHSF